MYNTIFDPLRKKNVVLTPEEEVRQGVIQWLYKYRGVPISLMMSEYSMKFNGLLYRADIVVFNRKAEPLMFIECKAPCVKIDQTVYDQVMRYNMVLQVRYIMVTNGRSSYLSRLNNEASEYEFIDTLPSYDQMISE